MTNPLTAARRILELSEKASPKTEYGWFVNWKMDKKHTIRVTTPNDKDVELLLMAEEHGPTIAQALLKCVEALEWYASVSPQIYSGDLGKLARDVLAALKGE